MCSCKLLIPTGASPAENVRKRKGDTVSSENATRKEWITISTDLTTGYNFLFGDRDPIDLSACWRKMLQTITEHWLLSTLTAFVGFLVVVAIYDVFVQTKHTILHNFPVVGHIRYWLERIGPEMRQYWVANDKEEMPFNRDERSWIYASSKGENNNFGFGSTEQQYSIGYPIIKHAAFPFPEHQAKHSGDDKTYIPCLKVMGQSHNRARQYQPQSVINISAMSFGSLGANAVAAMNQGAKVANCFHNTGEGGVSIHHCHGADIMWQIGTGYFGARNGEGKFSLDVVARKVEENEFIRCIEIKLSQGAKPGKGGILPGAKVSAEIAHARDIPIGTDCISPNAHSEFDTVDELIDWIEQIADRTGIPVGIKSAVGSLGFWEELADRMRTRGEGPRLHHHRRSRRWYRCCAADFCRPRFTTVQNWIRACLSDFPTRERVAAGRLVR